MKTNPVLFDVIVIDLIMRLMHNAYCCHNRLRQVTTSQNTIYIFSAAGSTSVRLSPTSIIIIALCISVTIFVIVFFIVGFTCSFTCHKCVAKSTRASDTQQNQSEPMYSECTYPLKTSQQEETPEMVDNVVYGLVK